MYLQGFPGCCGINVITGFLYDSAMDKNAEKNIPVRLKEITDKTTLPYILASLNQLQSKNVPALLNAGFKLINDGEFNYANRVSIYMWVNPRNEERAKKSGYARAALNDRLSGVKW